MSIRSPEAVVMMFPPVASWNCSSWPVPSDGRSMLKLKWSRPTVGFGEELLEPRPRPIGGGARSFLGCPERFLFGECSTGICRRSWLWSDLVGIGRGEGAEDQCPGNMIALPRMKQVHHLNLVHAVRPHCAQLKRNLHVGEQCDAGSADRMA